MKSPWYAGYNKMPSIARRVRRRLGMGAFIRWPYAGPGGVGQRLFYVSFRGGTQFIPHVQGQGGAEGKFEVQ